jgi:hypothetical protein
VGERPFGAIASVKKAAIVIVGVGDGRLDSRSRDWFENYEREFVRNELLLIKCI